MSLRMGTRTSGLISLALFIAFFCIQNAFALPTVSNVRAEQRSDGSGLVDIFYDLSGGIGGITVDLKISSNAGDTWDITPANVSGDIGVGIGNGNNKQIIWEGANDFPDTCWPQTRFRVTATDASVADELTIMQLPEFW